MNIVFLPESIHNSSPSLANLFDFSQLIQQVIQQRLLLPMQLLDGHQYLDGTSGGGLGRKRTADERDRMKSTAYTQSPGLQVSAITNVRQGNEVKPLQEQLQLHAL